MEGNSGFIVRYLWSESIYGKCTNH